MRKLLLAFAVTSVVFSSCKKSGSSCSLSASALPGNYKLTAINYKLTPTSAPVNILTDNNYYTSCERDNIYKFLSGGAYDYVDAGTVCSPDESYTDGTWSLSGNTFVWDGYSDTITSFDCNGMSITEPDSYTAGDEAVYVFSRQ